VRLRPERALLLDVPRRVRQDRFERVMEVARALQAGSRLTLKSWDLDEKID
jgi:hypothetical protein